MQVFPTVPWSQLKPTIQREWRQGEHVLVIGPTGVGKTTLIAELIPARNYVVVFVTKVHDDTITDSFRGFDRIEEWPPQKWQSHVLLWPKPGKTIRETILKQRRVFGTAMDAIFQDRGWTPVFDEQHYMCTTLGLLPENTMFQHQGRSSKLSCVNGTQRPAHVPLVTYSGSTHCFIWKNTQAKDMGRLSDIGGVDHKALTATMPTLGKHEFLYVNTRNGFTARSQVER